MSEVRSFLGFCMVFLLVLARLNEQGTSQRQSEASRYSATSYKKLCIFFCQKCCTKCLCVPSGTYGNKQTCPCYNNWKTKRGGPKCP